MTLVVCPICNSEVPESRINIHIDNNCSLSTAQAASSSRVAAPLSTPIRVSGDSHKNSKALDKPIAPIFTLSQQPSYTQPQAPSPSSALSSHPRRLYPGSSSVASGSREGASAVQRNPTHSSSLGKRKQAHILHVDVKNEEEDPTALAPDLNFPDSPTPNAVDDNSRNLEIPLAKRSRTSSSVPLSERLRPARLDDFVGHEELIGRDSPMMRLIEEGKMGSVILWGPPGCGKTTLARLIAQHTGAVYREFSATTASVAEVREAVEGEKKKKGFFVAKASNSIQSAAIILFVDEIHRFSKSQQDIFLPWLERGQVQLIGATTENPSFKVNHALLSRCRTFNLNRLSDDDISGILHKGVQRVLEESSHDTSGMGWSTDAASSSQPQPPSSQPSIPTSSQTLLEGSLSQPSAVDYPQLPHLTTRVVHTIVSLAGGDARTALSLLELVLNSSPSVDEEALLTTLRSSVSTSYDRTGDDRYEMISALHKSIRGSDGSAALYWLARMLTQGEDPMYIARRLVVCASEDIGLADPHALPLAIAAMTSSQMIGMPECRINLSHAVAYLAEAPKSTRAYTAYARAEAAAKRDATLRVPMRIRNALTALLRDMGCGAGYRYNPDYRHPVYNGFLPDEVADTVILKTAEAEQAGKAYDEEALYEWEQRANEGEPWEGRSTI